MNKLTKTAKTLDTITKVLQVIAAIGIVASIVAALILAAGLIFDLDPHQLGEVEYSITFDNYTIMLSEDAPISIDQIWTYGAATTLIGVIGLTLAYVFLKYVRAILEPMKEGKPFHNTVTKNLKKLGYLGIIMCAADAATQLAAGVLTLVIFPVSEILGDHMTGIDYLAHVNMGYLLAAGVCLLLSYIFDYGTQLQQLSDETL